jgi:hypothetical protein
MSIAIGCTAPTWLVLVILMLLISQLLTYQQSTRVQQRSKITVSIFVHCYRNDISSSLFVSASFMPKTNEDFNSGSNS